MRINISNSGDPRPVQNAPKPTNIPASPDSPAVDSPAAPSTGYGLGSVYSAGSSLASFATGAVRLLNLPYLLQAPAAMTQRALGGLGLRVPFPAAVAAYEQGMLFDEQDKHDLAGAQFRMALDLDPENSKYKLCLGRALMNGPSFEEGVALCRDAIRLEPLNASRHYFLGNAFCYHGHNQAAEACFREAVRLKPADSQYQMDLGDILLRQERWQEAEPILREAVRLDPAKDWPYALLGKTYFEQGKYGEAEDAWREAIARDSDCSYYRTSLGETLDAQDRYGEAEKSFREAVALRPSSKWAQYELADNLLKRGMPRLRR